MARRRPLDIEDYATQEEYLQALEETGGMEFPYGGGSHQGGPQYEAMLQRAMRWGAPREQTHREIQEAQRAGMLPSTKVPDVQKWLEQQHLGGYEQAKAAFQQGTPAEREGGFASEATWQTYPEHLRLRRQGAIPVSELPVTEGKYPQPIIPTGYIRRGREAHVYPTSAITEGSFMGTTPEGKTLSTFERSKMEKRSQLLGAHETIGLSGLERVSAPLRAGRESQRPDIGYRVKAAIALGGDVGPPGQGYIDPSAGRVTQQLYKTFAPKEGEQFDWTATKGATWGPGESVKLASGLTGFKTGKWSYTVTDITSLRGGGYGATLERSAGLAEARIRAAEGSTKLMLSEKALGGITDPQGRSLGVQFYGGMKDVQGYAYEHFAARGKGYLASRLGMKESELPSSYQELGRQPMEAFGKFMQEEGILQTIHVPETLTTAWKEKFAGTGALVGEAKEFRPGLWQATVRQQALVGDIAKQFSQEYPVRRPFLSQEELQNLQRQQPDVHRRVMRESMGQRMGYQEMLGAALAGQESAGGKRYPIPAGTQDVDPAMIRGLSSAAETLAGEGASSRAVRAQFMQQLAQSDIGQQHMAVPFKGGGQVTLPPERKGGAPRVVDMPESGVHVMAPAQTQLAFGAKGKYADEEVSKLLGANVGLLMASGSGDPEGTRRAAAEAIYQQGKVARSPDFVRKATGAFLGSRGAGDKIRGSRALEPHQAYVPGRGGQAISMTRFPTSGERAWMRGLRVTGLTEEEAVERGINPKEMTASIELQQALSGDFDGDINYALSTGRIVQQEDGTLTDSEGRSLDNARTIKDAGERAVKEGAGELLGEMAGATGKTTLTLDQARGVVLGKIAGASESTPEQIEEQIGYGSEMKGRIGKYFNAMRRGMATVPEHGREPFQKLWNVIHGRAQRPAVQLEQAQKYLDLANVGLWSGSGRQATGGYKTETGEWGRHSQVSGVGMLQEASSRALVGMRGEGGEHVFSPQEIGQLMGGPAERQQSAIARAVAGVRKAPEARLAGAQVELARAMPKLEDWALQSPVGRHLVSQAVKRAQEKGAPMGRLGLSAGGVEQLLSMASQQEDVITATKRARVEDPSALAAKVEAQRRMAPGSLPGVPQPKAAELAGSPYSWRVVSTRLRASSMDPVQRGEARPATPREAVEAAATPPVAGGVGGRQQPPPPPPEGPSEYWDQPPEFEGDPSGRPQPQRQQRGGGVVGERPITLRDIRTGPRGEMILKQESKVREDHVTRLKEINSLMKKYGEVLEPITRSTEKLDTLQRRQLTRAKSLYGEAQRIGYTVAGGLGAPETVAEAQQQQAMLAPHMRWMKGAQLRLDEDVFAGGAGGGDGGRGGLLGAEGPLKGIDRLTRKFTGGWELMRLRRIWAMTGGAAMGQIPVAGAEEQAAAQAAMTTMPMGEFAAGGMATDMMSYQAQQRRFKGQMGRAAYGAWGWTQEGATGQGLATAAGIGLPALGGGLLAGSLAGLAGLSATGVGAPIAGGLAAAGTGMYMGRAQTDEQRMAIAAAGEGGPLDRIAMKGTAAMALVPEGLRPYLPRNVLAQLGVVEEQPVYDPGWPERGQQMTAGGDLTGLRPKDRVAAVQYATQQATAKGGPLEFLDPTQAGGMLAQWMRFTPGAGTEALEDPRMAAMAMRGFTPETFAKQAQQWGKSPMQWQEFAAQMMGVTEPESMQAEFVAGQYQPLQGMGLDVRGKAYGGQLQQLTTAQRRRVQQFAGGNRYLWSQMGRELGAPQAVTMEEGGLPVFTTGVGAEDYTRLGLQTEAAQGGMWGIQAAQRREGIEYGQAQRAIQRQAYEQQVQMLTGRGTYNQMAGVGGAPSFQEMMGVLGPTPDSMWGLQDQQRQAQYAQAQRGFGRQQQQMEMGQRHWMANFQLGQERWQAGVDQTRAGWGLQEQQAQLGYAQAMGGTSPLGGEYTGRFAFQEARIGMGLGQFRESQALSIRAFESQQAWQGQDFERRQEDLTRQYGRGVEQRGWTQEDWSFQEARGAREFGWQMEDYEENIRFATGRQRKRLITQQGRAVIRRGEDEAQVERQQERQEQIWAWQDEDFERTKDRLDEERERNEELADIQRERFEMQMRHQEESAGLATAQLEEQKLGYEENFLLAEQQRQQAHENQEEMWSLDERLHEQQLEQHQEQYDAQAAHLKQAREDYEENFDLAERIRDLQRDSQLDALERQGELLTLTEQHSEVVEALTADYVILQQEQQRLIAGFQEAMTLSFDTIVEAWFLKWQDVLQEMGIGMGGMPQQQTPIVNPNPHRR